MKDLMAQLHNEIFARFRDGRDYSFKVSLKLKKAGLSEISIYNKFAEHIVENDLDPKVMMDDLEYFLRGIADNLMIIKNEDRFQWLYKSFNDLKWSGFDDKHFICTKCGKTFNIADKATSLKSCKPCFNEYNKEHYLSKKTEIKKQRAAAAAKKAPQDTPTVNEEQNPQVHPQDAQEAKGIAEGLKAIIEQHNKSKEFGRFMQINDLITEPLKGKVTAMIEVEFNELIKLLTIVDPYLKEKPTNDDAEKPTDSEHDQGEAGSFGAITE